MATARNIVTLALESMNKLSPGETLDADLAAACLRRLNSIADDWSAGRDMMPQEQTVSGTVTGASLTLATGSFAAITTGDEILNATSDNYRMTPITYKQYQNIWDKTTTARPQFWAHDGISTVYLYPTASANVIALSTRKPFTSFADLDTVYTMPSGFEGAFAATLAVAMAPALLGKVSPDLVARRREALFNIQGITVRPEIIDGSPLARRWKASIITGTF
jgi:hypothetical protein